jgi:S-formylglutathione hydrolase FrmB
MTTIPFMNGKIFFASRKDGHFVRYVFLLGLIFVSFLETVAQSTLRVDSFYMPSIGRTKELSVLLPKNYDARKRYPVLYLLHGHGGDHTHWTKLTKLMTYTESMPLIVVMPDAENSWYVNSATVEHDRFEDYIVFDLPRYVQQKYSIDTSKQAIAGLSMGGYGAVMLALKHPRTFRFAGSLSGALSYPRDMHDTTRPAERSLLPSLRRAFGETTNGFRAEHDVFHLVRQSSKVSAPYIYLVMGTADGFRNFLPANRAMADLLRASGMAYEYHETPGGHNWQYWDQEVQPLLKRLRDLLQF